MTCNAFFVAVILPASWAVGIAEHLASAVNMISGITAEEEYCLSVQGGGSIGRVRVRSGSAHDRIGRNLPTSTRRDIAHLRQGSNYDTLDWGGLACHLIVFWFAVFCAVSPLC